MLKRIGRLLVLLMVLFSPHHRAPSARAQGGLVFRPYWTFTTETPVTYVQSGDIDNDGLLEVVVLTAGDVVYVVENDGDLAWRYEADFEVDSLRVIDLESDGAADEILLVGRFAIVLLRDAGEPICVFRPGFKGEAWGGGLYAGSNEDGQIPYVTLPADLDGDGELELLFGMRSGIGVMDSACHPIPAFRTNHLVIANWAGDLDGDGQPEMVPSMAGSDIVYAFDGDRRLVWQQAIDGGAGLVQGGGTWMGTGSQKWWCSGLGGTYSCWRVTVAKSGITKCFQLRIALFNRSPANWSSTISTVTAAWRS